MRKFVMITPKRTCRKMKDQTCGKVFQHNKYQISGTTYVCSNECKRKWYRCKPGVTIEDARNRNMEKEHFDGGFYGSKWP